MATFTRPFQIIQAQCKHHVNFVLSGDLLIKGHCRHHRYSAVKKIFEASPTIFRGLAFFGMKYLMQNLLSKEVHRQAEGWTEKLEIELGGGNTKNRTYRAPSCRLICFCSFADISGFSLIAHSPFSVSGDGGRASDSISNARAGGCLHENQILSK